MVIAEDDNRRFTVDNLAASWEELSHFLTLFFEDNEPEHRHNLCLHIPRNLASDVARQLAPALISLTGGLMSYIVTAIRTLYFDQKFWSGAPAINNSVDHVREILAMLNHPTVLVALRKVRLSVTVNKDEEQALINFIREYKGSEEQQTTMDARYFSSLQKKALVRQNSQGGCIPWSPLVFDILAYRLLQEPGHKACSFQVDSVIALITHLVNRIKSDYSNWVYENGRMKHDDEINSAIASVLKNALGQEAVHRGPAKQRTKGTYLQVDHAIYWLSKLQPTLIETCVSDVPGHVNRFGATTGTYKRNYDFDWSSPGYQ